MRIVAVGDVGVVDNMIHIGDEAMFEAATVQLRARGVDQVTAVSANPVDTAARYQLAAIHRADQDAVREAIRSSDAVIVTGGGNLSSLWPQHILQRSAIGKLAAEYRRPLVVTGQTIGPHLDGGDQDLVRALLNAAQLVGLREGRSYALCEQLGVRSELLNHTVDDASYLVTDSPETAPYCLVTFANHVGDADRDAVESALARLLDHVADTTGLAIRFTAHFGSIVAGPARGDEAMHERVAARMRATYEVVPTTDSRASARLARNAALVVCSRYHPAVFAVSAGVPTIGISVDDYTDTKLSGALGNFGQTSVLSTTALLGSEATALVERTWAARDAIRGAELAISATARAASTAWWDDVAAALRG
ncbi:MAG: polysaccharide pyruvyl transferase family protein [Rhodoglobus sp.]